MRNGYTESSTPSIPRSLKPSEEGIESKYWLNSHSVMLKNIRINLPNEDLLSDGRSP